MELHELMSAMESEFANAIAENNKFQNGNFETNDVIS